MNQASSEAIPATAPAPQVREKPPTVMIVDDDAGIVRTLSTRCKRLGLNVVTAGNGLQAILKARQNFPDLMIVDINMPEADGFKVCEWVLRPDRPGTNIVVLTGKDDLETFERCDAIGAYYVPKSSQTWDMIRAILAELYGIEAPEAALPQLEARRMAPMPVSGPRVLIVDDDPDIVRALAARLRKLGITVFVADNGIEAYRLALREQPHAVIADYLMPKGGGHYLIWRLRDNKSTADIPIFIITGEIETEARPFPREHDLVGPGGATKVFRKPLFTEGLLEEVKRHCGLAEAPAP